MTQTLLIPIDIRLMQALTRLLMAGLVSMGVGVVGWWGYQHPAWSVKEMVLVGDVAHQSVPAIRSQLAGRLQGSFMSLDVVNMQSLLQEMPWVRQAVVQRVFPNRLRITISEHEPRAWWGEVGAQRLVNSYGELFEASADEAIAKTDEWAVLDGPVERSRDIYAMYVSLVPLMAPLGQQIEFVRLTQQGSWDMALSGGAAIAMGNGDLREVLSRVQAFVASLPQLRARYPQNMRSVDLRYGNGYAIRLDGVTTGGNGK